MESSTIKSKIAFKKLIEENLTYSMISNLTFEEYKKFVFSFFTEMNRIRSEGIKKEDVDSFLNKHYSNVMVSSDDDDVMFERRFTTIMEELTEFCSSPHFWRTDFDIYMEKWNKFFLISWFKEI
jgi:hypothetical protein